MPTNRELQDEIDELRLDLEQAQERERARGEELAALRGELAASEARSATLQETVNALTAAQASLQSARREREQILLARVAAARRNMDDERASWEEEKQSLE